MVHEMVQLRTPFTQGEIIPEFIRLTSKDVTPVNSPAASMKRDISGGIGDASKKRDISGGIGDIGGGSGGSGGSSGGRSSSGDSGVSKAPKKHKKKYLASRETHDTRKLDDHGRPDSSTRAVDSKTGKQRADEGAAADDGTDEDDVDASGIYERQPITESVNGHFFYVRPRGNGLSAHEALALCWDQERWVVKRYLDVAHHVHTLASAEEYHSQVTTTYQQPTPHHTPLTPCCCTYAAVLLLLVLMLLYFYCLYSCCCTSIAVLMLLYLYCCTHIAVLVLLCSRYCIIRRCTSTRPTP